MTTSGAVTLEYDVLDLIEEAYERAGVDLQTLNAQHLRSAMRSINMIFKHWQNLQIKVWTLEQETETLTEGNYSFTLDAGTVDIDPNTVVLRRSGVDTPMIPLLRDDYWAIPDKDVKGRPDRFWIDKSAATLTLYHWQAAENSTDQIIYWRIRRLYDVTAVTETPDVIDRWVEALTSELAARLFGKLPLNIRADIMAVGQDLERKAAMRFDEARDEDRERGPSWIGPGHVYVR